MRNTARRGFTLLEALLAIVLAALLFGGISMYTSTWTGRWSAMLDRGTREDTVAIVLDRIVEDIESARPVFDEAPFQGEVAFEGTTESTTFMRDAYGFDARAGVDRITYANTRVGGEQAIVRSRRDASTTQRGEDLPLVRGDATLALAYAGPDGVFGPDWQGRGVLPAYVRVVISGRSPRPWAQTGYAMVRSQMPAICGSNDAFDQCRASLMAAGQASIVNSVPRP